MSPFSRPPCPHLKQDDPQSQRSTAPAELAFEQWDCSQGCAKRAAAALCNKHRTTTTPPKQERSKWGGK